MPDRQGQAARGNRAGYVGNGAVEDLDTAKEVILIGTNPAIEAPV